MKRPSPPAPESLNGTARIPYLFVLDELEAAGKGDAGLALWQTLRGVRDRIDAAPADAAVIVASAELLDAVPELRTTLRGMVRLLRQARGDEETRNGLVLGCAHLGLWAEGLGACRTAISFFGLAEEMEPERPHLGYHIGRIARKLALYDVAETWLKWARQQAEARGDWEVAALCVSGLGNLYRQRGNFPEAQRYHLLCLEVAQRHGLRTMEGDALYELAVMSFEYNDEAAAMQFVSRAVAAYGPGHGRIYTLAHDVAFFWMDKMGRFSDAAEMMLNLADYLWVPWQRILLYSNLTRAAAGAGWAPVFEAAWNETWVLLRQQPSQVAHSMALVHLALGAGTLSQWERAEMAAIQALRIASERGECQPMLAAEAILEAVRRASFAEGEIDTVFRDRNRQQSPELREEVAATSDTLVGAMQPRRDEAPEGPTRALLAGML
jgi:tetratricopeptide (TPR) repeat protein